MAQPNTTWRFDRDLNSQMFDRQSNVLTFTPSSQYNFSHKFSLNFTHIIILSCHIEHLIGERTKTLYSSVAIIDYFRPTKLRQLVVDYLVHQSIT